MLPITKLLNITPRITFGHFTIAIKQSTNKRKFRTSQHRQETFQKKAPKKKPNLDSHAASNTSSSFPALVDFIDKTAALI